MKKIVFVCLGNICRSPMAEMIMKDLSLKEGQAESFELASRATSNWEHGNPVHPGTQEVLRLHGIYCDPEKTSVQIKTEDFYYFDRVIAMDETNLRDLKTMAPQGTGDKVGLLLDESIPDPWFTGDFEETFTLVHAGCQEILAGCGSLPRDT